MSTQDNNSLEAKINALGMIVSNQVLASTGSPTTASRQMWVDSDSRLASGTKQPFALGASQSTVTSPMFTISGISTGGLLTTTLVTGADVTTATKHSFVRVDVTDDNGVVSGSAYLELFTLT